MAEIRTSDIKHLSRIVERMNFRLSIFAEYCIVAAFGILLLVLIASGIQGLSTPFGVGRLILGLVYVLLIPGYYLHLIVFPNINHLDAAERFALSLVISIALIPPIALLLDYFPEGLHSQNIVVTEGVIIVVTALLSGWQRLRQSPETRFFLSVSFGGVSWWTEQNRLTKVLILTVISGFSVVLVTGLLIVTQPSPSGYFTEFYVIGRDNLAEDFPFQIGLDQPVTVTVGVENHEGVSAQYSVQVLENETPVAELDPFELPDNGKIEKEITFELEQISENDQIKFILYRDGDIDPYRLLRLWIKVGLSN